MNGVAITTSSEVVKFAHTRSGMRQKVMPGARMVMMVTRKLSAVMTDGAAAHGEEEERGDEVLDPDHLVVGVDAEVVLPARGAVTRVVLGPGRASGDVVQPVVERPDAGEESDRGGDHSANRDDHGPVERRRPAPPPAKADDQEHPEREEEGRHPQRAAESGAEEETPRRAVRRLVVLRIGLRADVIVLRRRHAYFPFTHETNC